MCTNLKWIYNRYIGREVLCKCGKCLACQQEKADKTAMKIVNHSKRGIVPLFVHLTYNDMSVPYIRKSEIKTLETENYKVQPLYFRECLNVYRNCTFKNIKDDSGKFVRTDLIFNPDYCLSTGKQNQPYLIYKYPKNYEEIKNQFKSLRGQGDKDRIGVIFWPDLQNFFKRLRKKVAENSTLEKDDFTYFACGELGKTYHRPHFHLLLYVPFSHVEEWKCAVTECWPFADKYLTLSHIEIAKNAASYVATYVTKSFDFPKFFRDNCGQRFRERYSHSKYFGISNKDFQFERIYKNVKRGVVTYPFTKVINGESKTVNLCYPKSIINRYIPFDSKGFGRFSDVERVNLATGLQNISGIISTNPKKFNYSVRKRLVCGLLQDGCLFDENQTPRFVESSFEISERLQVFESYFEILQAESKWYHCYNHFYIDYLKIGLKIDYEELNKSNLYAFKRQPELRFVWADFMHQYILCQRTYLWTLHFDKIYTPLDNIAKYDNLSWRIKDESLLNIRRQYIMSNFKNQEIAYEKVNAFNPNYNAERVARNAFKIDRFNKKHQQHLLNDKIFNYAEY